MKYEYVADAYERLMDALEDYVNAEKRSTRDFLEAQVEPEPEETVEIDGEVYAVGGNKPYG